MSNNDGKKWSGIIGLIIFIGFVTGIFDNILETLSGGRFEIPWFVIVLIIIGISNVVRKMSFSNKKRRQYKEKDDPFEGRDLNLEEDPFAKYDKNPFDEY